MTKDKITITELRSKIYRMTSEIRRSGKTITVTENGEDAWKMVPIKKKTKAGNKGKAAALKANNSKTTGKRQETIWEKWERLGPRDIGMDFERFRWDEKAWEKKWDKILGISPGKGSGKGKRS